MLEKLRLRKKDKESMENTVERTDGISLGQLYKVKRQKFGGDVLLYDSTDYESGARIFIVAQVKNMEDKNEAQIFFRKLVSAFSAALPQPLQETTANERMARVNFELRNALNEGSLKSLLGVSFALVEINNSSIAAATRGETLVCLARGQKLLNISNGGESAEQSKIISSFVSGKLQAGDTIVISLKSLFNFISTDQLTTILRNNPAQEGCDKILASVRGLVNDKQALAALIVSMGKTAQIYEAKKLPTKLLMPGGFRQFIGNLNPKFVRVFSIALIFVIFTGILISQNVSSEIEARQNYEAVRAFDLIRENLSQAETAIIFRDTNRAEALLADSETLLAESYNLDSEDAAQAAVWKNLQKRWQELNKRLKEK
ncbi:MAG: hypothetical protein A3J48_03365 [Candidatus Doudnabacteria bacterium RIFCSPHIGHO2_02_FULL_46_11]|uniref:Uncharacterized protein n=1 Tax=Candidatus Doudnabacteria bacterium RIFCSPHIGHO2_02_FULL_46_11 TaxID=1817832 RepID=A0A1F5P8E0_9BACT|nr:MAG: hypothetical protein A3J48_03365 [Candidatus Doudnabacteria bacterium RIFCSPHIGHO2_02_FULL_46_11]